MIEKLDDLLSKTKFSGILSIKKDDEILYSKAVGYRDRANEILNNVDTSFGIASGTKLFTALGILKLVEKGLLELDDLAFDIVAKPFDSYDSNVTIKHLLTHTSGIPDYYDEDFIEDFENFKVDVPWFELRKPSDYRAVMPNREMKFPVGEKFNYNNGAFVILAMIIEKIAGDYHKWITTEIIDKVIMPNTGFYFLDNLPKNCANGYVGIMKTNIYMLPIVGGGDGGLFTSTNDMFKFWNSLLSGDIVNDDLVEEILKPHAKEDDDSFYGLGMWLSKRSDNLTAYIVGQDPGVSFYSGHDFNKNVTFNILSNTEHGAWDISKAVKDEISKL